MKRLKDMKEVSIADVEALAEKFMLTPDGKSKPSGVFNTLGRVANAPRVAIFTFADSASLSINGLKYAAKRTMVQTVCEVGQDAGVIKGAFVHLNPYPDAKKMLYHYLTGGGDTVEIDTGKVFMEDSKLKDKVLKVVQAEILHGKQSGVINIKQDGFGNENWRNAFGSINIDWIKATDKLSLSIRDVYDWHPGERRTTQCVHQVMAMAVLYGAKKMNVQGTVWEVSVKEVQKDKTDPNQPQNAPSALRFRLP